MGLFRAMSPIYTQIIGGIMIREQIERLIYGNPQYRNCKELSPYTTQLIDLITTDGSIKTTEALAWWQACQAILNLFKEENETSTKETR